MQRLSRPLMNWIRERYRLGELTLFQKTAQPMDQTKRSMLIRHQAKQRRQLTIKLLLSARETSLQKYLVVALWLKMTPIQTHLYANTLDSNQKQRKIQRNYLSECIPFTSFQLNLIGRSIICFSFLFSPCTSKPIKQRVEAFEKLQTPQKETRTRARLLTSESEVSVEIRGIKHDDTFQILIFFVRLVFFLQKSKVVHGSLFSKNTPSEQAGKHSRTNSATRYQSAQKPLLTKSQSVEEIRKKAQVSDNLLE